MKLVLASASPRRRKLLKDAGYRFSCVVSRYPEHVKKGEPPPAAVRRHALEKARAVAKKERDALVIGADTIVHFGGRIIRKPRGLPAALAMLRRLAGRTHTVYTGVALLKVRRGRVVRQDALVERTRVTLKKMSDAEIRRYFRRVDPLDKAGAYAIQAPHGGIVKLVRGSFSNAVGLPLERLHGKLEKYRRQ